jgi:predicted RNA-binding protein
MAKREYWLDLFTGTTWQEFLAAGGKVSGFPESRWTTVRQVRPGDYLLCYVTGISRFIGVLEVVKPPYKDSSRLIWQQDVYPCRLDVKQVEILTPETAIPILDLKDQLSIFDPEKSPSSWTGYVRAAPARWKASDGELILQAIIEGKRRPVPRPFDPKKLVRRPSALKSRVGAVTIPESDSQDEPGHPATRETSAHGEIQWILAKLGNDMGLDVWVARNDRNREVSGGKFTDLPKLKSEIPVQFDEATNKTIELIDVLWLQRNSIVAAFETEHNLNLLGASSIVRSDFHAAELEHSALHRGSRRAKGQGDCRSEQTHLFEADPADVPDVPVGHILHVEERSRARRQLCQTASSRRPG